VIRVNYRLCVSTKKDVCGVRFAYAVYNHHDFCVYKRKGVSEISDELSVYVSVCADAILYFNKYIKNKYYTEHFSELLDEDGSIVLCPCKELCDAFLGYRSGERCDVAEEYSALLDHFATRSVSFEFSEKSEIQSRTDALLDE